MNALITTLLAYAVALETGAPIEPARAACHDEHERIYLAALRRDDDATARDFRARTCRFSKLAERWVTAEQARAWAHEEQQLVDERLAGIAGRARRFQMREGPDGSIGFYRREPDA